METGPSQPEARLEYSVRLADLSDAMAIAEIYNQGIEDRLATLETRPRTEQEVRAWFLARSERYPVLVATVPPDGEVCGWASLNVFNPRQCYDGVADVSAYVARGWRGRGAGAALVQGLIAAAGQRGFHKLVLAALAENTAAQRLYTRAGFREVGVYRRQGRLDGRWVDVLLMELLL